VLLPDEPTGHLDAEVGAPRGILEEARRSDRIVVAAQDSSPAELADRVYLPRSGRVEASGPAEEVPSDWETLERTGVRPLRPSGYSGRPSETGSGPP